MKLGELLIYRLQKPVMPNRKMRTPAYCNTAIFAADLFAGQLGLTDQVPDRWPAGSRGLGAERIAEKRLSTPGSLADLGRTSD